MVNYCPRIRSMTSWPLVIAIAMIQYLSKTSIAFTLRQRLRLHPSVWTKNYVRKCGIKAKDSVEEESSAQLDWDQFDYSHNPKNLCFDKNVNKQKILNEEDEAEQDEIIAKKVNKRNNAYFSLSPQDVNAAIKVLEPYINEDRQGRISSILRKRTKRSKFLFENPSNPRMLILLLIQGDMQGSRLFLKSGI